MVWPDFTDLAALEDPKRILSLGSFGMPSPSTKVDRGELQRFQRYFFVAFFSGGQVKLDVSLFIVFFFGGGGVIFCLI